MALQEQMERSGAWLFRYRSFLPIALLGLMAAAMANFTYIGGSHSWDTAWDLFCISISFLGLAIRAYTVGYTPAGTSGRNSRTQIAHSLNTTGIYSVVRHPLYVGNYVMWLGVAMFPHQSALPLIVSLAFWLYYERIMLTEERYLRETFGTAYDRWAAQTPAFVPNPFLWVRPNLPFSVRNVLKREYSGLFALILLFCGLEALGEYIVEGDTTLDFGWTVFLLTGIFAYIGLRSIRHRTRLLKVKGRQPDVRTIEILQCPYNFTLRRVDRKFGH